MRTHWQTWMAAAGALMLSIAITAQEAPAPDDASDPPSTVVRLSYAEGAVSLQPAGVDDWTAPAINRPLTIGDQLWSDRGSRAEIDLGSASVRLNESTALSVLNLSDQGTQLRLSSGSIDLAVRSIDDSSNIELDAPNAALVLLQPGEYRVDVDTTGTTWVTLRGGQAQVTGSGGQSYTLAAGQAAQFGANGAFDTAQVGAADDFDRWSEQREQRLARDAAANQYVASDVVGAAELNGYGQWQQEPEYGQVWYPSQVANDWAPYTDGGWVWVAPWGWTWVDNSPWGFAPFHYGRWIYLRERWGWVPAPPRQRAVYAPALVAWVGGPGGGGGVGWVPLAPGEVYVPGYRVSERYAQRVNVSNTVIVNNTVINNIYDNRGPPPRYLNRGAPRGVTVVSQSTFVGGQIAGQHRLEDSGRYQSAAPSPRPPAIAPERGSVLGMSASARVSRPPPELIARPVLGRSAPPAPPANFDRQLQAIRDNGNRPVSAAAAPRANPGPNRPLVNVVHAPQAPRNLPVPSAGGAYIPERRQVENQNQPPRPQISTQQFERNQPTQRPTSNPEAGASNTPGNGNNHFGDTRTFGPRPQPDIQRPQPVQRVQPQVRRPQPDVQQRAQPQVESPREIPQQSVPRPEPPAQHQEAPRRPEPSRGNAPKDLKQN